jgi:uncharacterized protein YndB with AHSA1/START domain
MDAHDEREGTPRPNRTTRERRSDRELVFRRSFAAAPPVVFAAWTTPAVFERWWVPKSLGITLLAFDADVRPGGRYRLVFGLDGAPPMEFFGRYIDVTPPSRLVWTNEEGVDGGAVTTVTFEDLGGATQLVMHDLYPSKESLDEALASGSEDCKGETFDQLEALLSAL